MDNYYDMEAERKSNSRRLRQVGRRKTERKVYFENERNKNEKNSTFSLRMIIVMLILSGVMFLKQVQVLDDSTVYTMAMSEMQKQLTVEDIRKAVVEEGVYPVMNWIEGK